MFRAVFRCARRLNASGRPVVTDPKRRILRPSVQKAFRSESWSEHRTLNTCFPNTEQCSGPTLEISQMLLLSFSETSLGPLRSVSLVAQKAPESLKNVMFGARRYFGGAAVLLRPCQGASGRPPGLPNHAKLPQIW